MAQTEMEFRLPPNKSPSSRVTRARATEPPFLSRKPSTKNTHLGDVTSGVARGTAPLATAPKRYGEPKRRKKASHRGGSQVGMQSGSAGGSTLSRCDGCQATFPRHSAAFYDHVSTCPELVLEAPRPKPSTSQEGGQERGSARSLASDSVHDQQRGKSQDGLKGLTNRPDPHVDRHALHSPRMHLPETTSMPLPLPHPLPRARGEFGRFPTLPHPGRKSEAEANCRAERSTKILGPPILATESFSASAAATIRASVETSTGERQPSKTRACQTATQSQVQPSRLY